MAKMQISQTVYAGNFSQVRKIMANSAKELAELQIQGLTSVIDNQMNSAQIDNDALGEIGFAVGEVAAEEAKDVLEIYKEGTSEDIHIITGSLQDSVQHVEDRHTGLTRRGNRSSSLEITVMIDPNRIREEHPEFKRSVPEEYWYDTKEPVETYVRAEEFINKINIVSPFQIFLDALSHASSQVNLWFFDRPERSYLYEMLEYLQNRASERANINELKTQRSIEKRIADVKAIMQRKEENKQKKKKRSHHKKKQDG